jgi:two-component system sensor histidine kinase/response regulator
MIAKPRKVRFGLQARVLLLAIGLSLPALIIIGWLSLDGISQARDAAVEQSETTLLAQAELTLQDRALDKAELYDRTLLNIQRQAQTVAVAAEQAFGTPRDDLRPPDIELFWLAGEGPVANPPAELRTTVAQSQIVAAVLKSQVAINSLISQGYIATTNGILMFHDSAIVTQIPDGFDARVRPWYVSAVEAKQPIWTKPYVDAISKDLNITTAIPVYISGRLVSVIGLDILLTTIQSDVLRLNNNNSGYAFLMDDKGNILVRPELDAGNTRWDETFKTQNLFQSDNPALATIMQNVSRQKSGVLRLQLDGGDRYLAYAPMETTGWIVGLVLPIEDVVAPARQAGLAILEAQNQLRRNLLAVIMIAAGIVLGIATAMATTLIRPLRRLDEGAQRIAAGQLDLQLAVRRDDEIGRLSGSFNRMTAALREKIEALEVNAEQMAAINETSNELKRLRSLAAVLDNIPSLLCQRLGFDRAVLYLVREDTLEVVSVSFGPGEEAVATQFMQAVLTNPIKLDGATIEAGVVRSRQAVIVDNPWEHPQVIQSKQAISQSDSYVQAPIVGRTSVLGLISADYHTQKRPVTVQDASLLLNFADMVGLTIENAFSFQNLEDLVAQRTVELREALDRAQAADRLKSQFLASVSHELRTPLNAIIGFSTVLLDELTPLIQDEQREDLQTINNNGRYLLDLINDILDMARIEAGRITLHREPTKLRPVVDAAVDTLRALNNKPVQIRVDVSPELPLLDADPTRLRQIVINLLSNALKFTERGQIVIRGVRRVVHDNTPMGSHHLPQGDWIVVSVQDTGIGMDAEAMSNLFQEFRQVHVGARGILGSGLGLSITRRLIDLHEGELWVDSKPNVGSTFSFAIATAHIIEPAPAPEAV